MTITGGSLLLSREQLRERLEARRAEFEARDAAEARDHQRAEAAFLAEFRARLRAAVKWDYKTAKANDFRVWESRYPDAPRCPRSLVSELDSALRVLAADGRKSFTISDSGIHTRYWRLLTWAPPSGDGTVC